MTQFIATTLRDGTPIALVALGGVFAFRVGIFHLGLEGLMIIGAFVAVTVTIKSDSVLLGLIAAIGANLGISFVFWLIVVKWKANAIIAGLGLSTFGVGASSYGLEAIFHTQGAIQSKHALPQPVSGINHGLGVIVSNLSIMVWLLPGICVVCWLILRRTRFGLRMAAVGEYPFAARSAGISVPRMRLYGLLITGVLCALGGADLALGGLSSFSENITNGRGYLAFAAILFGAGSAGGATLASLFFGLADAAGIQSQLHPLHGLPTQFVLMLPYVLTIIAVFTTGVVRGARVDAASSFNEFRE